MTKIGKEKFEDFARQVEGYLRGACAVELSRNQTIALQHKVLECLGTYIKEALQIPVTVNTMVNSIYLLPHAVDLQFPAYAEMKMLLAVINPTRVSVVQSGVVGISN